MIIELITGIAEEKKEEEEKRSEEEEETRETRSKVEEEGRRKNAKVGRSGESYLPSCSPSNEFLSFPFLFLLPEQNWLAININDSRSEGEEELVCPGKNTYLKGGLGG